LKLDDCKTASLIDGAYNSNIGPSCQTKEDEGSIDKSMIATLVHQVSTRIHMSFNFALFLLEEHQSLPHFFSIPQLETQPLRSPWVS
jgi:hypothetical protein